MVQCAGGTEPKPLAPVVAWIGGAAVQFFAALKLPRIPSFLVGLFPLQLFDVADLCATEPHVSADPTLEQWKDWILGINPNASYVRSFIWDSYVASIWPDFCQCVGSTGGYCTIKGPLAVTYPSMTTNGTCGLGTNCSYVNNGVFGDGASSRTLLFPAGQHKTRIRITPDFSGTLEAYGATGGEVTLGSFSAGVTTEFVHDWSGAFSDLEIAWRNGTGTGGGSADLEVAFMNTSGEGTCTSAGDEFTPPDPVVDPAIPEPPADTCSTTADLCTRMTRLETILRFTDRSVAWLQSSLAPDRWTADSPLTGLTGNGSIAASDILGVYVQATVPGSWGTTYENPDRFVPAVGSIQWSIDGAPMDSILVHYGEQQIFGAPPATDEVLYNFKAGVTGTVSLLHRDK